MRMKPGGIEENICSIRVDLSDYIGDNDFIEHKAIGDEIKSKVVREFKYKVKITPNNNKLEPDKLKQFIYLSKLKRFDIKDEDIQKML
eukprot:CAMPEP_0176403322 /NCGR_PEP_ID=MMETSP0126-20121128/50011_1 /TAXON_ID=141414 ORGANISM="Strombidinopsis acuminatum, Strain SPMC142" /NCGR_SAMPLE_ID=MMETSP0126 /ASSEMBLY_ACC=CAM_ASM_000229 /LENGTH=87 /DNA_ID=CAMNT_0017781521 /DNA_START=303 /DNA_END=566 /DNA_ORIENTATION=-